MQRIRILSAEERKYRAEAAKKWRKEHPEYRESAKVRAKKRRDERRKDPVKYAADLEYQREWRRIHPKTIEQKEKQATRMREKRAAGLVPPTSPEKRREYSKRHDQKHPEKKRVRASRWYQKNKEVIKVKSRAARILKRHGMAAEEYDRMMSVAVCAGCRSQEKLVLDHCHSSLKSRGILCDTCNKILGLAKDDIQRLENLVYYLRLTSQVAGE